MPRRRGGGKRGGRNRANLQKRELQFKEDGQEYAQALRMLGNGRLEAYCFDGVRRMCTIRGQMRKRVWINVDDVILVGLREYQDDKADVILKYTPDEVRNLKAYGELPEQLRVNDTEDMMEDYDSNIQFAKITGNAEEDDSDQSNSDFDPDDL